MDDIRETNVGTLTFYRTSRLSKGESCDGRDSFRTNVLRPSVSKSFSFGGYTRGMLSRGDSVTSTHSAGARLTKQGETRLTIFRCKFCSYKLFCLRHLNNHVIFVQHKRLIHFQNIVSFRNN